MARNPAGGVQTLTDVVINQWMRMVTDAIDVEEEIILKGAAVQTLDEYKRRVGRISGLREALDLWDRAAAKVVRAS